MAWSTLQNVWSTNSTETLFTTRVKLKIEMILLKTIYLMQALPILLL